MLRSSPSSLDDYQIEPELLNPTPRRVRERPYMAACQLRLMRGAVFLFCLVCWFASISLHAEHDRLNHQQLSIGYVTDMSIQQGKSILYNVDFSYNDQKGGAHTGQARVNQNVYESLKVNSPFRVYYVSDTPDVWRLSPASETSVAELQTNWYFGIGAGTVAAAFGLWAFKSYRLSRIRLLREGTAVPATVTRRRIAKGSKGETYRFLTYEWVDAGGAKRSKEMRVSEAVYDAHPKAMRFTAIYLPGDAGNSVPYSLINEAVAEL